MIAYFLVTLFFLALAAVLIVGVWIMFCAIVSVVALPFAIRGAARTVVNKESP